MQYRINVNDAVPDFEAQDEEGNKIITEDWLGTPVVLYFYPKNDTPGCTLEACAFRDNMDQLTAYDVIVIGVSPDSAASDQSFIQKHSLNFSLIPDENKELCKKFDVIQEKTTFGKKTMGVERTTFFIDRDGIIRWIERPVKVEGHIERVIQAIKRLDE